MGVDDTNWFKLSDTLSICIFCLKLWLCNEVYEIYITWPFTPMQILGIDHLVAHKLQAFGSQPTQPENLLFPASFGLSLWRSAATVAFRSVLVPCQLQRHIPFARERLASLHHSTQVECALFMKAARQIHSNLKENIYTAITTRFAKLILSLYLYTIVNSP